MASDFDDPFKELEESVMEDMRKVYSEKVIEHFLNPRNLGEIPDADGCGNVTGPCGDTMQICLRVMGERIMDDKYMTDGYGTTIACGSFVTELIKGRGIAEALQLAADDILSGLDGLPEESVHCSKLAADTLKAALRDYLSLKREPWKRAYRRA